jgi:hypothetical protein
MGNRLFGTLMLMIATAGLVSSGERRASPPAPTLGQPVPTNLPASAYRPASRPAQTTDLGPVPATLATTPLAENGIAPHCTGPDCAPASCCFGPYGSGRMWGSAEFLLWWTRAGNVPPLATTRALGGTNSILDDGLGFGARPGARFTIGSWLNCDCTMGVELGYFFLNNGTQGLDATSSGAAGSAVLARPFFNVVTGRADEQLVASPGVARGTVRASANSNFQGADLNLFCNWCCQSACCPTDCCQLDCAPATRYRVDWFVGPRWLQLDEDLVIAEQVTDARATFTIVDRFETRNSFYGGQIGARAQYWRGRYFVNVLGKLALGNMHQEVRITGTTIIDRPGAVPSVQQGGLLAQPTNIGNYSRDVFVVVPEIGMNLGYQLTEHVCVFAGYTFLYVSNVVRPGDQIDLGVNPTQVPSANGPVGLVGPRRPAFAFHDTDFWAQGINLGVGFQW